MHHDHRRFCHFFRKLYTPERAGARNATEEFVTLRFASQGALISEDLEHRRAVAVSATWLYPGANGLLANIGITLAHDWAFFCNALRDHTSPTNFTYADRRGNIGWHAAGGLPERPKHHDGMLLFAGMGSMIGRAFSRLKIFHKTSILHVDGWEHRTK